MKVFTEFPELNVEGDVFRAGTLLEMVRTMATELARMETTRRWWEAKGETLRPREHGDRRVSRLAAVAERHLSPDRFDGLGGRRGGEN